MAEQKGCAKCGRNFKPHEQTLDDFPENCCTTCIAKAVEKRRVKARAFQVRQRARRAQNPGRLTR